MIPNRIKLVNSTIKRIISEAIEEEIELPPMSMVTVTDVDTSKDLSYADVLISIIPDKKEKEIMKNLNHAAYNLQQLLFKELYIRKTPKLRFRIDKVPSEAEHIDELLNKIKKNN